MKIIQNIALCFLYVMSIYLLAWLGFFRIVVGPNWDLAPEYFGLSWNGDGFELVAFVQLGALSISSVSFIGLLIYFFRRK